MSLRGRCGVGRHGKRSKRRVQRIQSGNAGNDPLFERLQRQHEIEHARRGDEMAEGPLECGDRRRLRAEHAPHGRASDASEARVPLPCATIMPTASADSSRRPRARVSIARLKPSPSGRTSTMPVASVTQPEPRNSPSTVACRAWASAAVSSMTAAAPSPKTVPLRSRSNGRKRHPATAGRAGDNATPFPARSAYRGRRPPRDPLRRRGWPPRLRPRPARRRRIGW